MSEIKLLVNNSKAKFLYFLEDFLECGIELKGSEIKSIRHNGASLKDSYVIFKNGEAFLLNMHIAPYDHGNSFNHEPNRTRKLLLHKKEILKMEQKAKEKVMTVVPTKVYLKKGRLKIEIALAKGKKLFDKRETIKKRDDERMMAKMKKGIERQ
jgi:SsrA-binding protein